MCHLVILEAAHILVCSNTVWAEEAGTVTAPCHGVLLCLAASTQHPHLTYIIHVHHIHHHHVQWQLADCSDVRLLLTHWTYHNSAVTQALANSLPLVFSGCKKFLKTRSTQHMKAMQNTWLLIASSTRRTGKLVLRLTVSLSIVSSFLQVTHILIRCLQ